MSVLLRRSLARVVGFAACVVLASTLAGCATEIVVAPTAGTATVRTGERLVVDFGEINSSVGDEWVVVDEPDESVLGPSQQESTYLGSGGETGAPNELRFVFDAVGRGTTSIEFEYRFRGSTDVDDIPAGHLRTATIDVTVD